MSRNPSRHSPTFGVISRQPLHQKTAIKPMPRWYHSLKGASSVFNDFTRSSTKYVFGSEFILENVDDAIMTGREESLKLCIQTWTAALPGFENIYGGLFELRCHRKFVRITRAQLKVKAKRVLRGNSETNNFAISLPVFLVARFSGNDPDRLKNDAF